jgi:hypothetical protein
MVLNELFEYKKKRWTGTHIYRDQSGILIWWPAGHQLQKSGGQTKI